VLFKKGDILSQWRSYTSDGKGICIAFDENRLNIKHHIPSVNEDKNFTIGYFDCVYDTREQKRRFVNY
jgi:hypothetical protein